MLLTSLCALAVLLSVSTSASAAYKVEKATFRATLSGKQTTSWTMNQSDICGTVTGSGSQTFTYHQTRPVKLVFTHYVGYDGAPWVEVQRSPSGIPVAGTASRDGKVNPNTTNPNCRGTPIGPPQAPPAPDCGTKHYSGYFAVSWYRPQDFPAAPGQPVPLVNALLFDEARPDVQFSHCPFNGPLLMQRLTPASLSDAKVFGKSKRLTLRAEIHQHRDLAEGVVADATVSWTMQLTRVG
jgi:hypothetical protein